MKLALTLVVAVAALATPGLACEMHKDGHNALKTVAAEPPAAVEAAPAAMTPAPKVSTVPAAAFSAPEPAGWDGCPRLKAKQQTVYLTQ